ncbi:MAG: class I tRNA ligase family protein, partial [Duncaniella sp.]|nr:class I tRNA ligase family protein [Duncaniella sp.]
SKSLGNSPDPLDLIDKFGADGVRMGIMLAAPAGNDIMFDEKLCENGRNFCNKIWNAFRLVKGWEVDRTLAQPACAATAVRWFESKLSESLEEINDAFSKFRISEALMAAYRLFRDEFSSWFLEMVKPDYQKPVDGATYDAVVSYFDALLRVLHPFMPFITEELWQHLAERADGESVMYAPMPEPKEKDSPLLEAMETAKEVVNGVRGVRAQRNIPARDALVLRCVGSEVSLPEVVARLANLSETVVAETKDAAAASFMVGTCEYNVPLLDSIDVEAEKAKIAKDIAYYEGFLKSVEKKLSNERFVSNAPAAVVEAERKKLADATTKLEVLRSTLSALGC